MFGMFAFGEYSHTLRLVRKYDIQSLPLGVNFAISVPLLFEA